MPDYSFILAGKAGDGIRQAGALLAHLLARLNYRIYFWDDYPSLIRGGHNFSMIRASDYPVQTFADEVDVVLALDEFGAQEHGRRLKSSGYLLYDSDGFKAEGIGIGLGSIVKRLGGKPVMRNVAAVGAISALVGISWENVESVVQGLIRRDADLNLRIARAGFEQVTEARMKVERLDDQPLPLLQGNEAIALGAARAGLKLYIAYPMTPASGILHFLARYEDELGLVTYHPENEIAAVITAIGGAYAGARTMVGSSGGGFALMTEGVSLCAQSETPVVFVVSQRPGPSTGVPTYTMQGDLHFVLNSGQGDIVRLVVAPGDPDEAFVWTAHAMNLAWKYQISAFVLTDKNLSESTYSFMSRGDEVGWEEPKLWNGQGEYKRYLMTEDGVSPLAFPGTKNVTVKATSYEHDESGITTEEPDRIRAMQAKRLKKRGYLVRELSSMETVKVHGKRDARVALVCWGSTKGACFEVADRLDLKVIQPVVLEPFPAQMVKEALEGVSRIIGVEVNSTGALCRLMSCHGISVDEQLLKYDGRPFSVDELLRSVSQVIS